MSPAANRSPQPEPEPECCVLCGRPMQNMHHVTGWVLDIKLLAPVCLDCHKLIHDDWHTVQAGEDDDPDVDALRRVELRLTRLGMFLGRMYAAGRGGPMTEQLAVCLALWAAELSECRRRLAEHETAPDRGSGS